MKQAVLAALLILAITGEAGWAASPPGESGPAADSSRTFWADQRASGAVRFDYFRSSRELDDATNFLGTTAQIKLLPTLGDDLEGKLEARLTNPYVDGNGKNRGTILEGYLTWHIGKADLRAGRQIVPWGRADGVNPTDNLTPRDFKVLLPFEEDQRVGLTALKLDYALTPEYTLTAFTTPFFEPAKLPGASAASVEKRPARSLADSTVALKLDKTGGALDWSLSYFHGYSTLPGARLLGTGPDGPLLELRYDKIDVIGADFARNFGRYGVRGELAYYFTGDRGGRDPAVKNPYLYYVLGGDRTFFENLNVNLQLVGRWVNGYTDPETIADPVARQVAIQNAITAGQQDRASYGLSSRISNKWFNDTLEAELLVFANFTRRNTYLRPLLSYAFSDQVKGSIGAEIYTGAEETAFGRLKRNRGVFAELRISY